MNSLSNKETDRMVPTTKPKSEEEKNSSFPTKYATDKIRLDKWSIQTSTTLPLIPDDPQFVYTLSITTN